jgi:hypothetical protein
MQQTLNRSNERPVLVVEGLFFESRTPALKEHPYLFWSLVSSICAAASFLFYRLTGKPVFVRTAVPLCLAMFLVPVGIKLGAAVLSSWSPSVDSFVVASRDDLKAWFRAQMRVFEGTAGMVIFGLVAGVVAVPSFISGGAFWGLQTAAGFALAIIIFLGGVFAGLGLFNVFCLSRIVWRLGQFNIKVEAHPFGVTSTGRALVKCFFIAAGIWCVFTSSATVGLRASWIPMLALAAPSVIFFVAAFVICQVPIHNRMLDFKRGELTRIQKTLDSLAPSRAEDLTDERRKQIQFFERKFTQALALPEWPFDWRALLSAGVSGLASVLPVILDLGMEVGKKVSHGKFHLPWSA